MARDKLEIPDFLSHLPVWNGYPVPVSNVVRKDGTPDLTTISSRRVLELARDRQCGVCGFTMAEETVCFIGGPKSARHRQYIDPPMHERCARFAAKTCPYIATPSMARRKHGSTGELPEGNTGERPNVFVILCAAGYCTMIKAGGQVAFMADIPVWIEVLEETRKPK
jgi:hypothetical protein